VEIMVITAGKIYLIGAILDLILFLTHAYFASYIVEDPSSWFMFVTGAFLLIGLMALIGLMSNEIIEKRF